MFILFFTLFFLSLLTDAKAEENFNQHSSLEIIPKDYLLKDKNYFYFGVKIILEEGWKTYWKNSRKRNIISFSKEIYRL